MALPPGFEARYLKTPRSCCHLVKALYGLKQSGRQWYEKLHNSLVALKFNRAGADMALYRRNEIVLAVYVDNVNITGPDMAMDAIISSLESEFKLTGRGDAKWCFGVKIDANGDSISLSQS
jgi:hypothetical protein